MSSKGKNTITKYNEIDVSKIEVGDFKDSNDKIKWVFVNYGSDILNIQTPFVPTSGVPKQDQYHKDDTERANDIRLLFDNENADANELKAVMTQIDKKFNNKEFIAKLAKQFNSDAKDFKYQPIVKSGKDDRPDFMKVKFDMTKLSKISLKGEDGVQKVDISSVDDIAAHMRYKSTVRMILKAHTMYLSKTEKNDYMYGITFKVVLIEVDKSKSGNSNSASNDVFDYNEIDVSNIVVSEVKDNDRSTAQKIAMVNYMGKNGKSKFNIRTPIINIFEGGIPPNHAQFYPTDAHRAKGVKLPFDVNNPASVEFKKTIEAIDEYFDSEEFRQKIVDDIGGNVNGYEYQPIIREGAETDDDKKRADYIKVKLELAYETDTMLTKLQMRKKDGEVVDIDVKTIDDMVKYFRYKSNVECVLNTNKLYVKNLAEGKKVKKKTYGVMLKIVSIIVEESDASTATNNNGESMLDFVDDDIKGTSDYEQEEIKVSKISTMDLDDGVEEEEEVKPKKDKKSKKTKALDS